MNRLDNQRTSDIKRPSFFWLLTEVGRAATEASAFFPFSVFFRNKNKGDNHPVLVLPGFMASDLSTGPLRKFVNKLGYKAIGWNLGRNKAEVETLEILIDKVEKIYQKCGRKVSLIGWSLGGVYARQIAKASPDLIRQVITLGSPFGGIQAPNNASWLYNLISEGKRVVDLDPELLADLPKPAPVPTTAIYSKEDGIVAWETCLEAVEDEWHQNIQVRGSHIGLGINPAVLKIIADRLQYSSEEWIPFKPANLVEDFLFFPSFKPHRSKIAIARIRNEWA